MLVFYMFLAAAGLSIGTLIVNTCALILKDRKHPPPSINTVAVNFAFVVLFLMLAVLNQPE